ncbi:glycoside hydrolase family 2 protein [Marinilabiliaceae bacterium JC017]|nr:glycoside hydrolase family 2 protein [Marinilabiliaceae bacterium JC017]
MVKKICLIFVLVISLLKVTGNDQVPEFSAAGFFKLKDSGREIYDFNVGWRFLKQDHDQAYKADFDDSSWEIVNVPHGLEILSAEASGSVNYQGPAWYRKKFSVDKKMQGKKMFLYFEAIMGKCKIWVNGELVKEHFGGFLPIVVDLTGKVKFNDMNVIAVKADNSDDPLYPPGKSQKVLDFTYFGGIYRDVWLVTHNNIFLSDPNFVDKKAGGGLVVHYENLSSKKVDVLVKADIINETEKDQNLSVSVLLKNTEGDVVAKANNKLLLKSREAKNTTISTVVKKPNLWSPNNPYLYSMEVRILDQQGKVVDGVRERVGIRKIEFRDKEGFFLNGKPYKDKLIGANRHQDFACLGNALPNSGQWRDAKKLRDAGLTIIRSAHYPQDPAFMDACDELGLFVIVATPGWQFWNVDPIFEQRVYDDIKNMVRRDRNHPSVIMWEPILNETKFPDYFAQNVHNLVHEEYPWQGAYTACDSHAKGHEYFDVIYAHPVKGKCWSATVKNNEHNYQKAKVDFNKYDKCTFTREWGDNVDDWSSHNSTSRVARGWGEHAQLIQAIHYAGSENIFTSFDALNRAPAQHVGGTLWHSFDHQRGYHCDPFYGGIMDAFRQPKYSYYLFKSQRDPQLQMEKSESGPMIFIANQMSPFSEKDVYVFTNCDKVRLIAYETDTIVKIARNNKEGMKHPPVVFEDVFDFMKLKKLHRKKNWEQASIVAEGIIGDEVVIRHKLMPARKPAKIMLTIDNEGKPLVANGSDVMAVFASITDESGNVKRLNNYTIQFEVSGEATLLGNSATGTNPVKVEWGTAPALIKTSNTPGDIIIKARLLVEGVNTVREAELKVKSIASSIPMVFQETTKDNPVKKIEGNNTSDTKLEQVKKELFRIQSELNQYKLKEVEKQQQEFE